MVTPLLLLAAAPLALAVLVWLAQVLLGRRWAAAAQPDDDAPRPRLAVLIPAHDEAGGIAATLATLTPQLHPGDRLLVVADHCSDATAEVARAHGAEVTVRQGAAERGKGHALAWGADHLLGDAPEVLVIVDADCRLEPGSLTALARAAAAHGGPVQALYLMHQPPGREGIGARVATFAWRVKNGLRPSGWQRLGWPCQLTGSGMAWPFALVAPAQLASGSVVEDMQLGLQLAAQGHAPRWCPEARVHSEFPLDPAAVQTQRTRWEHGHLGLVQRTVLPLLGRAIRQRDAGLAALALDLAVPPLALLVLLTGALAALALGLWALDWVSELAPLALGGLLALLALGVLRAWWLCGRDLLRAPDLLRMPLYVLSKLPLYWRYLTRRQTRWVRTKRDR